MDGAQVRGIALQVVRRAPLVHHITNRVASSLQAQICYALGARAIMTDKPEEVPAASAMAQAGVINLGTPTCQSERGALLSAKLLHGQRKPLLLDPVGCASFETRLKLGLEILEIGAWLVKGNLPEALALSRGEALGALGVDGGPLPKAGFGEAQWAVKDLAYRFGCTAVATGERDAVAWESGAAQASGGSPLAASIPGLGCALGSAMACAMGAGIEAHRAALWGIVLFKGAALWAHKALGEGGPGAAAGPGTFLQRFLDGLFLSRCGGTMEDAFNSVEVLTC